MREGEPVWTARAEADLQREYSALEDHMEGSGDALLRMVDSSLRLLTIMPEMAPVYSGQHRRLVLRNSRFGLFYVSETRGIIVHAVCDLRQSRETILRHLEIREL